MIRHLYFLLICFFITTENFGQANKILQQKPPSWVVPVDYDLNARPQEGEGSAVYYLLLDEQENIREQEYFLHYAYKILSSEGLQELADISVDFDPSYETLIFHQVKILRKGESINQLPKQVQTIQRESNMERHLYDGTMTALIHLTDVRVGDVIEYSFTRKGYNEVFDGYINRKISLNFSIPIKKSFQRMIIPESKNAYVKYVNTQRSATTEIIRGDVIYTLAGEDIDAVIRDSNEPDWYDPYAYMIVSNLETWLDVSKWAAKHYRVTDTEQKKLQNLAKDRFKPSISTEEFVLEAVRFVQDEVRYLGFESGLNSHKPHPPSQVFEQRFGDCKDKSLLLVSLLKMRNVKAYPMLVNTYLRHHVSDLPPMIQSFNHCVVKIDFSGDNIFIDPTISNQGGDLRSNYFPTYGKGLIINDDSENLTPLPPPLESGVNEQQHFILSSIGGEAELTIRTEYRGSDADIQRSYFDNNDYQIIQKNYLTFYGNLYADIKVSQPLKVEDNRSKNLFTVTEYYKVTSFWKPIPQQPEKIYCEFYPQILETYFNITKLSQRNSPYRLTFPIKYNHEILVELPEEWTVTPERESINSEYYAYQREVEYSNQLLTLKTSYETTNESVPVDFLKQFVSDHEKMMSNLSYSLTYDEALAAKESSKVPGILFNFFLMLIGIGLVYWLYARFNPMASFPPPGEPIGGWLLLVAIGICITPLRLLYQFITVEGLISGQPWLSMWYAQKYDLFLFLLFAHAYNIIIFIFSIVFVFLFFQRRSSVPRLAVIFYGASLVMGILDNGIAKAYDSAAEVDFGEIFRALVAAAIWIPYFLLSERVKETFTNRYEN
jgi:transglutaminase-like putative cysteine protease